MIESNFEIQPLVSIIIPVYNGSNYVSEAIDSALSQTYKNIEIIVVNDGSKDDGATEQICLSYGNKIRYIYKANGGVSSALNVGIQNMKGVFFSWLSHDDKYESDKIEKQIEMLNVYKHNQPKVLLCESKQIDAYGNNIKGSLRHKRFASLGIYPAETVLENLLTQGAFCGCALLIHKSVFQKCGLFNEQLRYSQDALMWYKICLMGFDLAYSPEICVCNRVHNKQLTQTGRSVLYHDSVEITKEIIPLIIEKMQGINKLVYLFIKREAIWCCKDSFKVGIELADKHKILSRFQKIKLHLVLLYGKIRPFIRRCYYRFFKGVITQ